MTNDQLKQELCDIINEEGPIKMTELIVRIAKELVRDINIEQIFVALDDLVREKEVVEVEYVLPAMNYRTKSMYFPKGTEINVAGK